MRMWLLRHGNAYWNDRNGEWTSKELATDFPDSELDEIELLEGEDWVFAYETDD